MRYTAHTCDQCGQTKDYALPLSRGLAMATIAFYNAVQRLRRNRVHVAKEMVRPIEDFWGDDPKKAYHRMVEDGYMTFRMEGNLSFLHRHGIVAAAGDEAGVWILTKKGGAFLRGDEVPRVAIVSKVSGHQEGYWDEGGMTTISELLKASTVWWSAPITVNENETIPMELVTV